MKYRDKNDVQILESANGNTVRLTKIMYDVYLSHTVAKEYLLLIEKGLIKYTRKILQNYGKGHGFESYIFIVECKN